MFPIRLRSRFFTQDGECLQGDTLSSPFSLRWSQPGGLPDGSRGKRACERHPRTPPPPRVPSQREAESFPHSDQRKIPAPSSGCIPFVDDFRGYRSPARSTRPRSGSPPNWHPHSLNGYSSPPAVHFRRLSPTPGGERRRPTSALSTAAPEIRALEGFGTRKFVWETFPNRSAGWISTIPLLYLRKSENNFP